MHEWSFYNMEFSGVKEDIENNDVTGVTESGLPCRLGFDASGSVSSGSIGFYGLNEALGFDSSTVSCTCDLEEGDGRLVVRMPNLHAHATSSSPCIDVGQGSEMIKEVLEHPMQQMCPQETADGGHVDGVGSDLQGGAELLTAPEVAASYKTRNSLAVFREVYVGIIGAQIVYVLTCLLFGNAPCAIIVSLACLQSIVCHCDARPLAYCVNAILTLCISGTVLVSLLTDVKGLEPFKTDPVLKVLSYVYVPLCLVFGVVSLYLALSFRRLHKHEKRAIIGATNRLLGGAYTIDPKSLVIKRTS